MNSRRMICTLSALLAAASAFAQFTKDQKDELLTEIDHVLADKAFVPGVDLGKWRSLVDSRTEQLDSVDSAGQFTQVVNSTLKELGLSHIMLSRDRMRRGWGEDLTTSQVAQQGFGLNRGPQFEWVEKDAALLKIPNFERGYDRETIADIMDQAKDAKYMILDLRGDPGGEVENMRQFLGLVMPRDMGIGTFVTRSMATDYKAAKGGTDDPVAIAAWARQEVHPAGGEVEPFKGKIAVLIDEGSASAAEIVANALRENEHSPIVGSKSAGAVLVSVFSRLSYGFRIQFPIGDYVSHGGRRLEGHPLTPDVVAQGTGAVEAALRKLKETTP
jgi:hypothetical protein